MILSIDSLKNALVVLEKTLGLTQASKQSFLQAKSFTTVRALSRCGEHPHHITLAFSALGFGLSALRIFGGGMVAEHLKSQVQICESLPQSSHTKV